MAEDRSVGGLYLRLGLSLSELETGFVTAERTVAANISRLNRESNLIRIRSEIEIAGLDETADAERILQIRTETLNRQMAIQRDRVRILTAELQSLTAAHGENSTVAQRAAMRLERERLTLANLERDLRSLNDAQGETNDIFGELSNLLPEMPTKLGAAQMALGALTAGIGAAGAATKELLDEFRELQNQSYELNMSFPDTRNFLREMRLAGGDIGDYEGFIRGITDAYVKGEWDDPEFIALRKYGAEIVDATGRLKEFKDISEEVYQAWLKADEAGEGIEFLQLVGGESGVRDAIQLFQRLKEAREDAAKISKAGIDEEQLHKLDRTMNLVTEQASELKAALGDIFVPAAQTAAEKFFNVLRDGTEYLVENKEALQKWQFVTSEIFDTVSKKVGGFTDKIAEIAKTPKGTTGDVEVDKTMANLGWRYQEFNQQKPWGVNTSWEDFDKASKSYGIFGDEAKRAEEKYKAFKGELKDATTVAGKMAQGLAALTEAQKKNGDVLSQYGAQRVKEFKDELADLRVELEFSGDEYRKALAQQDLWLQRELNDKNFVSPDEQAAILAVDAIRRELIEKDHSDKIAEAIQTNFDNAADIEFEMTHTAFEKQIRDIERWEEAQKEKAETAEEISAIIAESAAKEAQAFEDEMDRIRGKLQSLDDKIFDIDHSQYEKDLRRIQQDYFKQAQEYQDMGAFTPEVKAKLDYLYLRQKQDIDKRAYESRTKGGDYTKAPEGVMQPYGGGLPIGLFADTSGIEALLYSKLDAGAQNEVNKIRGIENLAPAEQELKQLGETVRQTVDDFQSFEDLKSTLKEAADTQKTLDDRIKILTESTSKLAEAQNDFVGTLKNLSSDDSPQSKDVTSGKSIFAQKLKDFARRISETPSNAENSVPKIPNSMQKVSDAQYYTFPISVDLNRRLREILGIPLPESFSHKGMFATNENLKAMPADVDLSTLETSLSGIGENVQSILQSIQDTRAQENDRLQERFGALPNIEEYVKSVLLEMQSEEDDTDLSEYFSVMPKISEDVQSILQSMQSKGEIPDAPALQQLKMPEPNAALVDYLTPLNNIDGKLQSILQATQMRETFSLETVITPLNSINALVGNILTALTNRQPPQITVSPNNSINLGGAYVFDNALKQELVNDITSKIVDEITMTVRQATSQSSYNYGA